MSKMPERRRDIEVTDIHEELICYDPVSQKASCLEPLHVLVWRACDGSTSKAAAAEMLGKGESSEDLLELILSDLQERQLLKPYDNARKMTRSEFLAKWGVAAAALPILSTVLVPSAAEAQSFSTSKSSPSSKKSASSPKGMGG